MEKKVILAAGFLLISLFLVLLFPFVVANYIVELTPTSIPENVSSLLTISINNTYETENANIIQINITLPSKFIFVVGSNGTSVSGAEFFFNNSSNVLSWSKDGLVMNKTIEHFWFNVTVSMPGSYNFTVTLVNSTASLDVVLNVQVNDTKAPILTLNTPANYANLSSTLVIFNCTVVDNYNLSNITLFGNWSGWGLKNSTNISGNSSNVSVSFIHNLSGKENAFYTWACHACDTHGNCNFSENRTFTIDTEKPKVTLLKPQDEKEVTEGEIDFIFKVTDNFWIKNCSFLLKEEEDYEQKKVLTRVKNGTNESISLDLEEGDYRWKVGCYDYAGNYDESSSWDLIVKRREEEEETEETKICTENTKRCFENMLQKCINNMWKTIENCTYGCNSTYMTCNQALVHDLGNIIRINKTINNISLGERINFIILNESYSLLVKEITKDSITLEVMQTKITFSLQINEKKELDLNNDKVPDVLITLVKILDSKADLSFEGKVVEEKIIEDKKRVISFEKIKKKSIWFLIAVIAACIVIAIFGIKNMVSRLKKKRKLRGY
ncbi:MAG: hypothetical protein NZ889_01330 [Candidatus Pacearchaeota archaeon]|nr:hypothetical protein [Candidatus Pacearchaeota archaeon]